MIGMPALIEYDSFEENVELCRALGLDFIELNMTLPMYNHQIDTKKIKRLIGDDLKISLHLSESFDPFNLEPPYRKASLQDFSKVLEIAKDLDAFLINMHLSKGVHFTLPDRKLQLNDKFNDEYMTYVDDFCHMVQEVNIPLCIENTGIHDLTYIQKATDRLIKEDNIFLTYDIGHDITSGYKDKAYYNKHRENIKHFHIHDATPDKNHLELFTGDLDILSFLDEAKDKGASCVIEVKSSEQLIHSIKKIKDNQ